MKNSIFLFVFISSSFFGQIKFEKEYRIKEKEVHLKALNFINEIESKRSLKWYLEESSEGKSIEGKFKKENIQYSVEFDISGNLQDVEETIKLADLEISLQSKIRNKLDSSFTKFKVVKIQRQLIGENKDLIKYFKEKNTFLISGYELIVKGTKGSEVNLYEFFFNKNGIIDRERKVLIKSSVHLEY